MLQLCPETHGGQGWRRSADFDFARRIVLQPLAVDEIPRVAQTVPVAFRRHEDSWQAVAVFGLADGVNRYVTRDGRWRGLHVPAALRLYPFALLPDSEALALWDDYVPAPLSAEAVQPFFADGQYADSLRQAQVFLQALRRGVAAADPVLRTLHASGVLAPWAPEAASSAAEEGALNGLHKLHVQRFKALPDADWLALRAAGAIGWLHAHLESLHHVQRFDALAESLNQAPSAPSARPESSDQATALLASMVRELHGDES